MYYPLLGSFVVTACRQTHSNLIIIMEKSEAGPRSDQEVLYDYNTDLHGIGNCSLL